MQTQAVDNSVRDAGNACIMEGLQARSPCKPAWVDDQVDCCAGALGKAGEKSVKTVKIKYVNLCGARGGMNG